MSHPMRIAFAFAAVSLATAFNAPAAIVYNEGVSGDLSGDGLTPISISVAPGSNQIFGTTGRSPELVVDRDYFAITVPTGYEIVALVELAGTTVVSGVSFLAVQGGTQVTVLPSTADATGLLGWTHYLGAVVDTDILVALGSGGFGASDFVPPLPAGDYAFWIQDTQVGSSSYGFDIVLALPEPTAAAALLVGLLAFGLSRGRAPHA